MTARKYPLSEVHETDGANYRFVFGDWGSMNLPQSWDGWFRAVMSGTDSDGEYELYDTRDGSMRFGNDGSTVALRFVAAGGTIEPYIPEEEE